MESRIRPTWCSPCRSAGSTAGSAARSARRGLPEVVTVEVEIGMHRPAQRRGRPYLVHVRDAATEFQLVFFHAARRLAARDAAGRPAAHRLGPGRDLRRHRPDGASRPRPAARQAEALPDFEPVYPLTQGLTLKAMARAVQAALARAPDCPNGSSRA